MDLKCKGRTWVGNLCQKLEAMCVEVETVGINVKKMCEEVVQDFLPPTAVDPIKKTGSELSLEQNADVGTYKKSDEDNAKYRIKEKKSPRKELGVIASADKDSNQTSYSNGVSNVNPLLGIYKKSEVPSDEDLIKEKTSPHKKLGVIAPVKKYLSQTSFSNGVSNVNPLLLPSSVDPVKEAGLDLSLDGSKAGIEDPIKNKVPAPGLSEEIALKGVDLDLSPKESRFLMHTRSGAGTEEDPLKNKVPTPGLSEEIAPIEIQASLLSNLCDKNNMDSVEGAGLDLPLEQNNDRGMYKSSMAGIEGDPINKQPPPTKASEGAPSGSDLNSASSFNILGHQNNEKACDTPTKISFPHSVKLMGDNSSPVCPVVPHENNVVEIRPTPSSSVLVDLPLEQNNDRGVHKNSMAGIEENPSTEKPPSTEASVVVPAEIGSSSASSLNVLGDENNEKACDTPTRISFPLSVKSTVGNSSQVCLVVPCEDKVMDIGPTPSSIILSAECNVTGVGSGRSDDYNAKLAELNDDVKPIMEMIEEFDDVKLGESCVIMDSKETFFISPRASNRRSYRKRIQDAFASRMRSTKQREYEQLAILHIDLHAEINPVRTKGSLPSTLTRDFDSKNLPAHDLCESDWEIL